MKEMQLTKGCAVRRLEVPGVPRGVSLRPRLGDDNELTEERILRPILASRREIVLHRVVFVGDPYE